MLSTETSINLKHTLLLHSFAEIVSHQPSSESVRPVFSSISSFLSKEFGVTDMALVAKQNEKLVQKLGNLDSKFLDIVEYWIQSQNTTNSIPPAHLHCREFKAGSQSYYLAFFGPDLNQRAKTELCSFINLAVSAIAPLLLLQEAKNFIYDSLLDQNQKIAHDLKKPITMIKKLLKNLTGNTTNNKEDHSIEHLNQSLAYADDLLKDIISPNQNLLKKVEFNLKEVIEDSMLESQSVHEDKKSVNYQIDAQDDIYFYGDKQSIQRALINLVDNAVEATDNQGTVQLSAVEGAEEISICVSNTGSFIPEDKRHVIFEPRISFGKKSGTGLGLAIVKQVIDQHGGKVSCDSSDQQITSFNIILPNLKANNRLPKLNFIEDKGASLKIFVIDDDPFICELWQQEDYPIETFKSPLEFITHFSQNSSLSKNSVIITDYYFDDEHSMNGREFADYLKKQSDVPIILSSNISLKKTTTSDSFDAIIPKDHESPLGEILEKYGMEDDE